MCLQSGYVYNSTTELVHTYNTYCLYTGATAHSNAYFGEGRGPIQLDSVECSGYEISLTDCEIQDTESSQGHSLDVGVKCQPGMLKLFLLP